MWWRRTPREVEEYVDEVMVATEPPPEIITYRARLLDGEPLVEMTVRAPAGWEITVHMYEEGTMEMIANLQRALAGVRAMAQPVTQDSSNVGPGSDL